MYSIPQMEIYSSPFIFSYKKIPLMELIASIDSNFSLVMNNSEVSRCIERF